MSVSHEICLAGTSCTMVGDTDFVGEAKQQKYGKYVINILQMMVLLYGQRMKLERRYYLAIDQILFSVAISEFFCKVKKKKLRLYSRQGSEKEIDCKKKNCRKGKFFCAAPYFSCENENGQ
mmetsp:Transcript_20566/g.29032  ORF Transcript_20566/g.29032 Transcript_20566/m.29032 type:complete len:121 (+) Transcript_20566:245-607(+)